MEHTGLIDWFFNFIFSLLYTTTLHVWFIYQQQNNSILVRENSLEWNNPQMQSSKGYCCGASCCALTVMDDVTVLYFDDIYFDDGM